VARDPAKAIPIGDVDLIDKIVTHQEVPSPGDGVDQTASPMWIVD